MLKRAAGKIYGWIEPHMDNDKMLTKIKRVYICTDAAARDKCAEMYTDIIAKILLAFLVTCILAVILVAKDAFAPHKVVLTRDGYGGDVSTVTLETDIDGEKTDFDVDVMPLEYDPDDMEAVFEQGFGEIEDLYLGENESPDEVIYDLELVDHLDALGLDVQWISEDNELVSSDGRIGDIAEGEDRIVSITAVLTYRELSAERTYQIRVCGREETGREKALKDIREGIREIQAGSGDSSEGGVPFPAGADKRICGQAHLGRRKRSYDTVSRWFRSHLYMGWKQVEDPGNGKKEIRRAHVGVPGACG